MILLSAGVAGLVTLVWRALLIRSYRVNSAAVDRFYASCGTRPEVGKMALVIPFPPKQLLGVIQLLETWCFREFSPSRLPVSPFKDKLTLILYPSKTNQTFNEILSVYTKKNVNISRMIKNTFSGVKIVSADLGPREDQYYRDQREGQWISPGTTEMFFPLMVNSKYDYVFYHEPDMFPLRSGWLDTIVNYSFNSEDDFWLMGSQQRHKTRNHDKLFGHMNGNMVVKTASNCVRSFLDNVHKEMGILPYDNSIMRYLVSDKHKREAQHIIKHYRFTEYIGNFGDSKVNRSELLERYPTMQVVHGRGYMKEMSEILLKLKIQSGIVNVL